MSPELWDVQNSNWIFSNYKSCAWPKFQGISSKRFLQKCNKCILPYVLILSAARFLKYVWPFYIMHERVRMLLEQQVSTKTFRWSSLVSKNFSNQFIREVTHWILKFFHISCLRKKLLFGIFLWNSETNNDNILKSFTYFQWNFKTQSCDWI